MKNRLPFRFPATLATLSIAMTFGAQAASNTWVGATNVWDTATTPNWTSPTTWTAGDDAVFGTPGAGGLAVALTTVSAHNIDFNTTGYSIAGSTLTLTGTTPTLTTATGVSASISSIVAGASLTKAGSGTLTLSGTNTYTGATAVNDGILIVKPTINTAAQITQSTSSYAANGTSTIRFDGSAVTNGTGFAQWALKGTAIASGAKVELYSDAVTHNAVGNSLLLWSGSATTFTGSGSLNKEGAGFIDLNYTGALNGFTGTLNINGGTFQLQGGSTSTVGNFNVNVANGATFDIRTDTHKIGALNGIAGNSLTSSASGVLDLGNTNVNGDFAGFFGGPVALRKSGSAAQILSGTLSYTGTTTVNGGKLVIDGTSTGSAFTVASGGTLGGAGTIGGTVSVSSGGFIAPGSGTGSSISTLTISNNLTLAAGSKTICEINKTGAVLTNDQLYVNGVTYGGTLEVTASGDALVAGNEFKLFDATSYTGTFSTLTLPTLPAGLVWDTSGLSGPSATGTIRVSNLADTPVFSPGEGTFLAPQTITMTSSSGTTVYYTFASGGAEPPNPTTSSASGTPGSGFATVNLPSVNTWKVKAFATKSGLGDSAVALGTFTLIPTPVWTNTAGGFWSDLPEDATNWQNNLVADGSGIPADFSTLTLPADTTVTLDGDRTIGGLLFGDIGNQFDWTLDGFSTLTLAGAAPSIAVNNQTTTITTPLGGSNGLTKTGAGELILSGNGSLSGGTAINAGTLTFKAPSNANWTVNGGSKTIASGATLKIDFSPQTTQFLTTIIGTTVVNGTLNLSGTAASTNGWYVVNGTSALVASGAGNIDITDGGAVVINSAGALNGFTGAININGTSQLSLQGGTTSDSGTYAVNIATNAKFDLRTEGHTIGALNGSGSVIKSHNGIPGTGLFTIGNGNANGNFSGPMSAPAVSYNLVKTGTGTQVLGGALTYGGTTTVNGGTLDITGSLRLKPTTNGVVNTTGGTATLVLDGILDLDLSSTSTTAGNSWLLVNVTTLNETFGNAFGLKSGASNFTETSAGSGVWKLTSGANAWTFTESTGTLTVAASDSGYGSWMNVWVTGGFTGSTATGADPDNDGMKNLMEYVLNGNPGASSLAILPQQQVTATNFVFTFTRRVDSANDTTQVFEYGSNLTGWTPVNITGTPGSEVSIGTATGTAPNEVQTVTVTIPRTAAVNGKLFGRLQVSQP